MNSFPDMTLESVLQMKLGNVVNANPYTPNTHLYSDNRIISLADMVQDYEPWEREEIVGLDSIICPVQRFYNA